MLIYPLSLVAWLGHALTFNCAAGHTAENGKEQAECLQECIALSGATATEHCSPKCTQAALMCPPLRSQTTRLDCSLVRCAAGALLPVVSMEECFSCMQAPVFRELYSEKRVVLEERRMRVDDSPMGRFQEGFAGEAMTNNYRRPVIGYPADLALLGRNEVQSFFNKHYGPQRLCIAVVGDVQTDKVSFM